MALQQIFDAPATLPESIPSGRRAPPRVASPTDAMRGNIPPEPVRSPVKTTPLAGSFSLVRAAFVVSQHRARVWSELGLPSYVGRSLLPDPTPQELDSLYEDFLLFNYVPDQLLPSKEQFRAMCSPRLRASVVQSSLPSQGIEAGETQVPFEDSNADVVAIAAPPAFAERKQGLLPNTRSGPPLAYRAESFSV